MEKSTTKFSFHGKGFDYFKLVIINAAVITFSLGLYSFWARAESLKYFYNETEMGNSRFSFHGTGLEFFLSWLKVVAVSIPVLAILGYGIYEIRFHEDPNIFVWSIVALIIAMQFILPAVINESIRYRMTKTSWKGTHFGYDGNYLDLLKIMLLGNYLSIVTLGFYSNWRTVQIREYIISKLRIGDLKLEYRAQGASLFIINLKGLAFSIPTFGLYLYRWQSHLIKFFYENIHILQNNRPYSIKANISGFNLFKHFITNLFIILFTLGLATPWVVIRNLSFFMNNIELDGELDYESFVQGNNSTSNILSAKEKYNQKAQLNTI